MSFHDVRDAMIRDLDEYYAAPTTRSGFWHGRWTLRHPINAWRQRNRPRGYGDFVMWSMYPPGQAQPTDWLTCPTWKVGQDYIDEEPTPIHDGLFTVTEFEFVWEKTPYNATITLPNGEPLHLTEDMAAWVDRYAARSHVDPAWLLEVRATRGVVPVVCDCGDEICEGFAWGDL